MAQKRRTKADLEAEIIRLQLEIVELRNESAVFARVRDALPSSAEMTGFVAAKAEVALTLAAELDGISRAKPSDWKGNPPNVSAIAKELRACLDAVESDLGDADPTGFFDSVDVPTPVGDS